MCREEELSPLNNFLTFNKEAIIMKKIFVVRVSRPSLFTKVPAVRTFKHSYEHAIDAYRDYRYWREANDRDGRWPVLSVKVTYEPKEAT